jgi:hypothetical protein
MDTNPYSAPTTAVADPSSIPEACPRAVNLAVGLLGFGVTLRLLNYIYLWQAAGYGGVELRTLALVLGGVLLIAVICYWLRRGSNWARIVLLILTGVGFAGFCFNLGFVIRRMPEEIPTLFGPQFLLAVALPQLLNLFALHLLFFSSGNWFRRR